MNHIGVLTAASVFLFPFSMAWLIVCQMCHCRKCRSCSKAHFTNCNRDLERKKNMLPIADTQSQYNDTIVSIDNRLTVQLSPKLLQFNEKTQNGINVVFHEREIHYDNECVTIRMRIACSNVSRTHTHTHIHQSTVHNICDSCVFIFHHRSVSCALVLASVVHSLCFRFLKACKIYERMCFCLQLS